MAAPFTRARLFTVAGMALLTALAFQGSLLFIFNVVAPWEQRLGFTPLAILAGLLAATVCVLAAGALWGYAGARLLGAPARQAAWPAARTYGKSLLVIGLILEVTMVPVLALAARYHLNVHALFIASFVPAVAALAAWNVSRLAVATGRAGQARQAGRNSGIAAGLAFLIAGLWLQYWLGWQVGRPVWGQYNMITLTHICNLAASLAGGATAGWALHSKTK